MKKNLKSSIKLSNALTRLIPLVIKSGSSMLTIFVIVSIIHGVSFALITMYTQKFVDKATLFAESGQYYKETLRSLIVLGIMYVINKIANGSFGTVYRATGRYLLEQLTHQVNEKMGKIPPIYFEDTKQLDDIQKANEGMNNSVWFSLTFIVSVFFYIPYLLYLGLYLYEQKPILCLAILLAFLSMIISQILRAIIFSKVTDEITPLNRECTYYNECITGISYYKETRTLGGVHYFFDKFLQTLKKVNKLKYKASVKFNLFDLLMQIITVLCYGVIIYMLFVAVMNQEITIGVFTAVYYSLERLFSLVKELICDNVGYLMQDLGTITNYLRFLEISEYVGEDIEIKEDIEIEFRDVSFQYPQTDKMVLNNISFKIKPKETIAVVGENGSGKTTLIRLMMGIYHPTKGDVFINGINSRKFSMKSMFLNTSAVFQKFQKYKMVLRQNITISDCEQKGDVDRLDQITKEIGIDKDNEIFAKGYETMLSREFDGIDLSGGQWQRVAIARGYYKRNKFIVLDEPTSAIDPIEETNVYNQFATICKEKTAVVVTHRLGSAKIADKILVMDKGCLVESGTHEELIAYKGKYMALYLSQQKWYDDK